MNIDIYIDVIETYIYRDIKTDRQNKYKYDTNIIDGWTERNINRQKNGQIDIWECRETPRIDKVDGNKHAIHYNERKLIYPFS